MRGLDRVSKSRSEVLVVTCIGVLKASQRTDQSNCTVTQPPQPPKPCQYFCPPSPPLWTLSFGSVNDLGVRFSGGKHKADGRFNLTESSVSIRHASSAPHPSSEVNMEACLSPEENGEEDISVPSCVRGLSATLAVGHYAPGKHPVLYVRVR